MLNQQFGPRRSDLEDAQYRAKRDRLADVLNQAVNDIALNQIRFQDPVCIEVSAFFCNSLTAEAWLQLTGIINERRQSESLAPYNFPAFEEFNSNFDLKA